MTLQPEKKQAHIMPNIPGNKDNPIIQFGRLMEYNRM